MDNNINKTTNQLTWIGLSHLEKKHPKMMVYNCGYIKIHLKQIKFEHCKNKNKKNEVQ